VKPAIHTIGYEGADQSDVIATLLDAGVQHLLDVRIRAQSRKRGLSKSSLAEALASAGISYSHDVALGTPKEMMQAARESGYDWDAYRAHLVSQQGAIEAALVQAERCRTALLCFEADPLECHRWVVADELQRTTGFAVRHLTT
jgi:uncharacterized protein (DUF488 family)